MFASPKKIMRFILPVIAVAMCQMLTAANEIRYFSRSGSNLSVSSPFLAEDHQFTTMNSLPQANWGFLNKNADAWIESGVYHAGNKYIGSAYDVELVFDVQYQTYNYTLSQFEPHTESGVKIRVRFNPSAGAAPADIDKMRLRYPGAHRISFQLTDVVLYGTSTSTTLPPNLYVEGIVNAERYYIFDETIAPSHRPHQAFDLNNDQLMDELEVRWDFIPGAEEYDLEWTFVNDYKNEKLTDTYLSSQIEFTDRDFEFNSTRVRISDQHYRIPLLMDRGFVIYRIRGIGRGGIATGDFNKIVYGKWSTDDGSPNNLISDFSPSIYRLENPYLDINSQSVKGGHELKKNWQVTTSFAEDGKKKEVISYFDGSLRNRQTVTRTNSNNEVIVGETMYDHQGRGAIQVLPAPANDDVIKFYPYFNIASSNTPYSRMNFDLDDNIATCALTVDPMDSTAGASKYYSAFNDIAHSHRDYIPTAKGFPFTMIEYEPDNTGRIRTQTGVGYFHRFGSDRETKYFYGQPEQEQLDRLFASEVGHSQHYKKNMVVDANGQVSVSYLDAAGRVIATSLTGDSTNNLLALKNPRTEQTLIQESQNSITVDLLNKDNINDVDDNQDNNIMSSDGKELRYSAQKLVATESPYLFFYSLTNTNFSDSCISPDCYPLVYNLDISVKDKCGTERLITPVSTVINGDYLQNPHNCGNINVSYNISQGLASNGDLDVGAYTVEKVLKVNEDALNYFTNKYIDEADTNNCRLTLYNFYQNQLANNINLSGCDITCDECVAELISALGTRQNYIDGGSTQQEKDDRAAEWDAIYEECVEPCKPISICETGYNNMLLDVTPYGQYGAIGGNDFLLSVFNESNRLPHNNINTNPNWRNPVPDYRDVNGDISLILIKPVGNNQYSPAITSINNIINVGGQQFVKPQHLLNFSDFFDSWEDSWAKSLVQYHPEYQYFKWCDPLSEIRGSYCYTNEEFDHALMTINTFDAATNTIISSACSTAVNLTDVANILAKDPFFNDNSYGLKTIPGTTQTYKDVMSAAITNYNGSNKDMGQFASFSLHCGTWYGNDYTNCAFSNFGADVNTKDKEWGMFRGFYMSEKQKLMQRAADEFIVNSYTTTPASDFNYCGCIGENPFQAFAPPPIVPRDFVRPIAFGNAPISDNRQPCSFHNYTFYSNKGRRLGFSDLTQPSQQQLQELADHQMFLKTGLCPEAIHFRLFMDEMAVRGLLTSSSQSLLGINGFTPRLYLRLTGFTNFSSQAYNIITWQGAVSGTSSEILTVTLAGSVCTSGNITLTLPGSSGLGWNNFNTGWKILSITDIGNIAGNNFKLKAVVDHDNNATTDPIELVISGSTACFVLSGCTFSANVCPPTNEMKDLQELMNLLAVKDELENLSGQNISTSSPYSTAFNRLLASYLPASTDWAWQKFSGTDYRITSATFPNDYLKVTLSSSVSNADFFTNVASSTVSGFNFSIEASGSSINGLLQDFDINGGVNLGSGSCTTPPDPTCENLENRNLKAIETLLIAIMNGQREIDNTNNKHILTGTKWFSKEMHDFLSVTGNEVFALRGTRVASTFTVAIVDNNNYSGSPEYCRITLNAANPSQNLNFTQLNAVSNIQADENNLTAGKAFNFSIAGGGFTGLNFAWLKGTSCFPVKNCDECLWPKDPITDANDAYTTYSVYLTSNGMSDGVVPVSIFIANSYEVYSGAYIAYLASFTVTSTSSPDYVSISEFSQGGWYDCWAFYDNYRAVVDQFSECYFYSGIKLSLEDFCEMGSKWVLCLQEYEDYLNEAGGCNAETPPLAINDFCKDYPLATPICPVSKPPVVVTPIDQPEDPCEKNLKMIAMINAKGQYNRYIQSLKDKFKHDYIAKCMNSAVERFEMIYTDKEYHFTLYYYDQAGNLVRTVPPAGVNVIDLNAMGPGGTLNNKEEIKQNRATNTRTVFTTHTFPTTYTYNSLNQLIKQNTPDGGISTFFYDALGRLVVSQNAKQAVASNYPSNIQAYSYTRYDDLGRIMEVGQAHNATSMTETIARDKTNFNQSGNALYDWIVASSKEEITRTKYDEPSQISGLIPGSSTDPQQNLRNRVSNVSLDEDGNGQPEHATHYSYDIHGNVNTLVQETPQLAFLQQQYKRIDYEYDLVSGNVNAVHYHNSQIDAFHHYYEYDSDNRITNVYTADGFSPSGGKKDGADQDAKYFYYPHGPLARMETGDLKVQGMDYVYTIQGWIKGVNSTVVNPDLDQGRDGNNVPITGITNKFVTRDALSYSLSYFKNDYKAVAPVDNFIASTDNNVSLGNAAKELFNGNIRMMMTTITKPASMGGQSLPLMTAYRYDQLNRIKQMQAYGDINMGQNEWGSGSTTDYPASYQTSLSYDGNGNIIGLIRNGNTENGAPLAMDNLHYYYRTQSGGVYDPAISLPADASNQLDHVTDQVLSTNYNGTDIDNQSSNNYTYDEIGNMKSDVQENINKIEWTVYGKVSKVIRNKVAGVNSPDLEFHYDATGNRTLKLVKPVNNGVLSNQGEWTYTYYVRDAQGNVLATYDRSFENTGGNNWSDNFGVKEHDVYGSSRIGLKESNPALLLSTESFVSTSYTNNEFDRTNNSLTLWSYLQEYKRMAGVKRYEYGNHLGNVLVVTTDRRVPTQDQTNTTLNAFYTADVLSATDYYPFGMGMPERDFSSNVYKYGYNGKENDNEIISNGRWQDYGMRIFRTDIGRFLTIDPKYKRYPLYSPYHFAGNTPIQAIDLYGLQPDYIIKKGKLTEPVIALISAAFGFNDIVLRETELKKVEKLPGNYDAVTFYKTIKYLDPKKEQNDTYHYTDNDWLNMIAHEGTHRMQVGNNLLGAGMQGIGYGIEYLKKGYDDNYYEKEAYRFGYGKNSYMDQLLSYAPNILSVISDPKLSEADKSKQLKSIGKKFMRDVIIKNVIESYENSIEEIDFMLYFNKDYGGKKLTKEQKINFKALKEVLKKEVKELKEVQNKITEEHGK